MAGERISQDSTTSCNGMSSGASNDQMSVCVLAESQIRAHYTVRGMEIATLESVDVSTASMSAVENLDTPQKGGQNQEVLQELLERAGPRLTPCEKQAFFAFSTLMQISSLSPLESWDEPM